MSISSQSSTVSSFPKLSPKPAVAPTAARSHGQVASVPAESLSLSTPLKSPRPGSDMDQMVQDLQSNGLLPQAPAETPSSAPAKPLREPTSDYVAQMVEDVQKDLALTSQPLQVQVGGSGTIAVLEEPQAIATTEHTQHGHGASLKQDALLAGHIGTEIIEKVGHSAHHVTTHAAEHSSEVAHEAVVESLAVGKEAAHHLSTGLEVALGAGIAGAGILAVPIALNGVKELRAGIKEKDPEKVLEGVGNLAVGTRSAGTAAVMAGMLTSSEVVTQVAGVAAQTLTPLGIVHAGVDTVLGVLDLKQGKVTQGLLKVGTGVAIGAAAVVGGLPLTVAALGMVGVKTGHKIYQLVQEKKQAGEAPH